VLAPRKIGNPSTLAQSPTFSAESIPLVCPSVRRPRDRAGALASAAPTTRRSRSRGAKDIRTCKTNQRPHGASVPRSAAHPRPSATKPSTTTLRVDEPPRQPPKLAPRGMLACCDVIPDAARRGRRRSDREVELELTEERRRRAAGDVPVQDARDLRRLSRPPRRAAARRTVRTR